MAEALGVVLCALNSRQRTIGKDNGCHNTPNALTILRQYSWGSPLLLIHDRFMDKTKKHEHRNSNGLLKEILSDGDMHSSDDRLGALRDGVHAI
ncbi:hypothetical protein RHSIM_Rhsim04G0100200 [Rhododendron simsii]|uniref:Uncharacterized protein n=1 Tax=Rhododendron simsii TaxID=118357 RepID=A0A834H4Z9_RHOSS|nr:hypothetical protein RHSIM_Rhsim04G0100200 [Rhododendron simsii]